MGKTRDGCFRPCRCCLNTHRGGSDCTGRRHTTLHLKGTWNDDVSALHCKFGIPYWKSPSIKSRKGLTLVIVGDIAVLLSSDAAMDLRTLARLPSTVGLLAKWGRDTGAGTDFFLLPNKNLGKVIESLCSYLTFWPDLWRCEPSSREPCCMSVDFRFTVKVVSCIVMGWMKGKSVI